MSAQHIQNHALTALRTGFIGAVFLLTTAFGSGERIFAPSAEVWERWEKSIASSPATIRHEAWSTFLNRHVIAHTESANRLDYAGITDEDRQMLEDYIQYLSSIAIGTHNRAEQKAYWINLYNALTVKVVLDHYPVDSIRDIDISPGLFTVGPWDKELIEVEGHALSLNDIEHRILRPIWDDPLIHYGVNCASVGCPDLLPKAFTGSTVNRQLEQAARAYVNDGRGVSINDGRVVVSKIYDWFIEDFGDSEAGVLRHLRKYAEGDLAAALDELNSLHDVEYDWSLNDVEQ